MNCGNLSITWRCSEFHIPPPGTLTVTTVGVPFAKLLPRDINIVSRWQISPQRYQCSTRVPPCKSGWRGNPTSMPSAVITIGPMLNTVREKTILQANHSSTMHSRTSRTAISASEISCGTAARCFRSLFQVAERNDKVVGHLIYVRYSIFFSPHSVFVTDISIDHGHRRSGIGLALLNDMKSKESRRGVRRFLAGIWPKNKASCSLFTKAGFSVQQDKSLKKLPYNMMQLEQPR
ncbi:MAG: GNAT family N-acetyltransferase [Boseongicola sp.]|nr:MAG: GNAT family N-acetyltransferase [Boseongicola sp.]